MAGGSTEIIAWLLGRGYQVTGKVKSPSRVHKLGAALTAVDWQETSSAGRQVAVVPQPVPFARPLAQYAVRTPSADKPGGFYYAVLFGPGHMTHEPSGKIFSPFAGVSV